MDTAMLNADQITGLLNAVNQVFPDWQGFSDHRFEEEEVIYKRKAIEKAKTLLKESDLLDLIVQGKFDEFFDRLIKVAQSGGNLLFLAVPKDGDLSILFQEGLDKPAFCRAFVELIYGSGSSPDRLGKYTAWLQENRWLNKWSFPTYFLFVCHPESEMFVKYNTTKWFLKFSGLIDKLPNSPSPEIYTQLLNLCKQLWNELQPYHPRDYVDIQGFIWVAYSANQPNKKLAQPLIETDENKPTVLLNASTQFFDTQTFQLLEQLHNNPTQNFYNEHKQEFKGRVEQPFQDLMGQSAGHLRSEILELMETEKGIFSRFNKNDFGRMGTWDFYWGAFYPKGGKRTNSPQLSLMINFERLEIGFYIGHYGPDARSRFRKNCQENVDRLMEWFSDIVSDTRLIIGTHHDITIQPDGSVMANNKISWQEWLGDPEKSDYDLTLIIPKEQLLQVPPQQLIELVAGTFNRLFPFILLATTEDPMPIIAEYLGGTGSQGESATQPVYPLEMCSEETGIDLAELGRWVQALERKKQVILYGPPGTGKTYLAEKLAQHLVGGGDGFYKLIQFHPEFSYEDFVQGIRPVALPSGGLDYPVVPGRFVKFCEEARTKKNTCVLIIDEINRANLARVFGELMYLLEYRDKEVELAAGNIFKIPSNVRIVGTMNTADRSIALVDHALRRRFALLALYPNFEILRKYHERENTGFAVDGLIGVLSDLNKHIADRHYAIGPSYFLRSDISTQISDIWQMEIEPYLEEYFFDQAEKYQRFCWERISSKVIG